MYLSFSEYVGMGGKIAEGAFARQELRARKLIDRMTHGRIRDETPVRDAVKAAMFELIDAGEAQDKEAAAHGGREIAGMSNDGVSVSYAAGGDLGFGMRWSARKCAIITEYLQGETTKEGIALLYAGVDA